MSFESEPRPRGAVDAIKSWLRKGADAESVGLEPGWEYLDLNEFVENSDGAEAAAPASTSKRRGTKVAKTEDTSVQAVVETVEDAELAAVEAEPVVDEPAAAAVEEIAEVGSQPEALADIVADVISDLGNAQTEFDIAERINKRGKIVITVLSGKGGVGKTTTLLGLAGAAASQSQRVLLVDLDPQGSLSLAALDGKVVRSAREAFDGATLAELAVPSVWTDFDGSVDIVPTTRTLSQVDAPLAPLHAHSTLVNSLGDLSQYDLILIDAPATLATLAFEAIALAHKVLVVTEPSRFAISSAADAADFARLSRRGKRSWHRSVHVLLNKFDGTEESNFRSREVQRNFPGEVLKTTISISNEIEYANSAGVPVQAIPGVRADLAARQFEVLLSELSR